MLPKETPNKIQRKKEANYKLSLCLCCANAEETRGHLERDSKFMEGQDTHHPVLDKPEWLDSRLTEAVSVHLEQTLWIKALT